jgi:gamma-glutamyltranspeptidase
VSKETELKMAMLTQMPDFRETAPAAASEDMYNNDIYGSIRGGLASGVPGDLRGLEYLHKKHGVSFITPLF